MDWRAIALVLGCVLASACARSRGASDVLPGSADACQLGDAVGRVHISFAFTEGTLVLTWLSLSGELENGGFFGSSRRDDELVTEHRTRMLLEGGRATSDVIIRAVEWNGAGGGVLEVVGTAVVPTADGERTLLIEESEVRVSAGCGG